MVRVFLTVLLLSLTSYGQSTDQAALGHQLFTQGQYKDAVEAFEKVPAGERTVEVLNRLGVSYHMVNRLKEAEAAYKLALKTNKGDAALDSAAHNNLGALYYAQLKFSQADGEFRHAAEDDPRSPVIRRNLRVSRYARDNARIARTQADDLAKERPLFIDERDGEVLSVLTLMPKKDQESAANFEKRGDAFLARKMYDDAIIEYRKSIAIDKYNAAAVNRPGLTYHQSQKYTEAERQYREAIKLNPFYLDALNNLGTLQFSKKKFPEALDYYRKALKIFPDFPTVLQNAGACLLEMKRYNEAIEVYKRALQLDPKLFERQASGRAGTLIQMAQQSDMMGSYTMATIFAAQGDKDLAISYLYKANESGFKDVAKIKAEPAFATLAEDERFQRLVEAMSAQEGPRT